jgi:cytochrome c-type biogenesis protein CcmH
VRQDEGGAELIIARRQLAELDDLEARGLIAPDEHRIARAEAGRRLLSAADATPTPTAPATRGARMAVLAVIGLAAAAALAGYLFTGRPGLPDQPYRARLASWKSADPSTLDAAQLAAVLDDVAKSRPHDATPLLYLAQAEAASGQQARVTMTLREAARREPRRADVWIMLGQAETAMAKGEVTADARRAFAQAERLDPQAPAPRYFLGRAAIADGDVQGGLASWRSLAAALPPADPKRASLDAEIADVEKTGRLPAPQAAAPPQAAPEMAGDQRAFINTMVQGLAQRLKAHPDDPQGWARLIRSYRVLGDDARREAAAAQARRLFAGRRDALKLIDAQDPPAG